MFDVRLEKMKYDFGDSVQLRSTSQYCVVVGITEVDTIRKAEAFQVPLGTIVYTVEFADGSDTLVSEDALAAFGSN